MISLDKLMASLSVLVVGCIHPSELPKEGELISQGQLIVIRLILSQMLVYANCKKTVRMT